MLPYWFLFAVFAIGAFIAARSASQPVYSAARPSATGSSTLPAEAGPNTRGLLLASLVPIVLIGFRYRVGADYESYEFFFKRMRDLSFGAALSNSDIGYATLSWLVGQIGAGLWLVNLVCGILFMFGLVKFARTQPNPWLAISIAVPYLIIVVGMGLTRQAVAIGLTLAGLAVLTKGSYFKFAAYVCMASLFHRSALVVLPIIGLAYSRNRVMAVTIALLGSAIAYYVLTSGGTFERFQQYYVKSGMFESKGAPIRLAMNIPPAILLLLFVKRFSPDPHERRIYAILSVIAFISVILLVVYPASSTAIDRMALYVIPLQMFVLSRLPTVFADDLGRPSGPVTLAIILYSAAVEFVWLNYANFASNWVPYRFVPLHMFG